MHNMKANVLSPKRIKSQSVRSLSLGVVNNSHESRVLINSKANLLYLIAEYSLLVEIVEIERFFAGSWLIYHAATNASKRSPLRMNDGEHICFESEEAVVEAGQEKLQPSAAVHRRDVR
jgi:hypothetical protein